jgi:tetratricopeptide (TPR) repeat protein
MSRAPNPTIAPDAPDSAAGWPVLAVAVVLILAALGAYGNSFHVPLLLDDQSSISDNPSLRHLGQIVDVLSPPPTGSTVARPLLNLSFALNYAGGGLSVPGYHAVNLLIHICAGLALLGIVRRTLLLPPLRHRYGEAALPLAAFAALLWTLHPLQTEAVTYISQRAESLMGLFYLLTFYCFIRADVGRGRRTPPSPPDGAGFGRCDGLTAGDPALQKSAIGGSNRWLCLSVVACLAGMATKQVMVTAPVLVLLYDRAFVSGSFRSALANRRWYYACLAATWLLLGFLQYRSSLAAVSVGFQAGVSWQTYALTELHVVTDYLKLAFWPHPLVFDYGMEILVADPLTVVPYAVIVAAILIGTALAWRRSPMAGFLGAWFFLILAPTSTVVPIAEQPMAESRVYLPLAGVIVLVTLVSYALGQRRAFVVLGLVATGLGGLTVWRNHDYRSELSIWEDTVARCPHTSRGYCTLGVVFANMPGRLADAIAHYETALRLKPDYAEAHSDLANALAAMPGRSTDAIAHREAALRLKPGLAEAHGNLAVELAKLPGRLPDAITHFDEALRLKPDYAEAHNNLANALARMPGRLAEALAHYETALHLKPGFAEAHNNYANALAEMPGRLADAITHYEAALRLNPDLVEAHYNLAIELAKLPGRLPDAVAHFEAAVRLKPDIVEAHNNLAAAYAATGHLEAAINQLEIAARLDPASTVFRDNLEKLKARRKQ